MSNRDIKAIIKKFDIIAYNSSHREKKCPSCESLNTEKYIPLIDKFLKFPKKKKHLCNCEIIIGKPSYFTAYYKCKDCGHKFTCRERGCC